MATPTVQAAFNPLELLVNAIGGQSQTDKSSSGTSTGTQTKTATTGQTSNQTVTGTAELDPLRQVFAQQQAGITPDMLNELFRQGAAGVPKVMGAYGNAVGARLGNNDPVSFATEELFSKILGIAAQTNQQMLADSGQTAGKIGELTRGTTTSGTTAGTEATTGTSEGATTEKGAQNTNTAINTDMLMKVLGLGLGGSILGNAIPGGLGGGLSSLTQGLGGGLGDIFKQLLGASQSQTYDPATDIQREIDSLLGRYPATEDFGINLGGNEGYGSADWWDTPYWETTGD